MKSHEPNGDCIRQGAPPYSPVKARSAANRLWLTRRRITIAAVCLPFFVVVLWVSAFPCGMIVACFDCVSGHYEFQTFGYPRPWASEFRRLAAERYDVEVRGVAGCVVSKNLVDYVNGYNLVSVAWMQAKFGKDVVAECNDDAAAAWRLAHPNE